MKPPFAIYLLLLLAVASILGAPLVGMQHVPLRTVFDPSGSSIESTVLWDIRVPRVLTAFLAGAGLAVSGMAFQALFRNPLATPFTLGVSSGASLGAAIYVRLGLSLSLLGISGTSIAAFIGALLTILLVYGVTSMRGGFTSSTLLLAGVAISFFFSSLILAVQYTSNMDDSFRLIRWMMGGLGMVGYDALLNVMPFVASGAVLVYLMVQELDLATTGEDLAMSRGVDVLRMKQMLFFAVSLMVGGIVAVCGPIGFIGMMAPHICRLFVGPGHRYLFPATFLFGGMFLTACDAVARTVAAPAEIPVGIITALLGGPFFLWLLFSGKADEAFV